MGITASPFLNPIAAEPELVGPRPSAKVLSRRAKQRRQIQGMIAASYFIDALILSIYAQAGTLPAIVGPAYAACGLTTIAAYLVVSETGFTGRFKDHYLVVPQLLVSVAVMLVFAYLAPAVGGMFLCTLFLVFNFGSLRATPRQSAVLWTAMTIGVAWLFLLNDKPIGLPQGNSLERLATMLVFVLTIGRCTFLGIFSSAMRQSLYQRRLKLKEAYRRIEELAELDELTGSFNRRCIMRMLEEQIVRAQRTETPCAVALIDLDWFKRINDPMVTRSATKCSGLSPSRFSPTSAIPTGSAATVARNFCWCCPIRRPTARPRSSTGCGRSLPISTGAPSRRICGSRFQPASRRSAPTRFQTHCSPAPIARFMPPRPRDATALRLLRTARGPGHPRLPKTKTA
jgi:diguanylate cyclase